MTQNLSASEHALHRQPAPEQAGDTAITPPLFSKALLSLGLFLAAAYLLGCGKTWGDLALACMLACGVGNLRRGGFVVATLAMLFLAFPPFAWPLLYVICWAPLFYLWRCEPLPGRRWWLEAWIIGFAAAWITAPFLGAGVGANGRWLMAIACGIIGLQWLAIAAAVRATRHLSPVVAGLIVALVAGSLEMARTNLLDFPVLLLALPAASTPLAQWARYVSIFGVSAIFYFISFLLVPNVRTTSIARWLPPAFAVVTFTVAWVGGAIIASNTPIPPLPLSAILIQPHAKSEIAVNGRAGGLETAHTANRLTTEALLAHPQPDLIVWPETVLAQSAAGAPPVATQPSETGVDRIDLAVFRDRLLPRYGCPCLVGASIIGIDGRLYNSGCLLGPDQSISRHDKLKLIVLAETLPSWLPTGFAALLRRYFNVNAPYSPGKEFRPLLLKSPRRAPVRIAVSLCYEMHFPWLPQYLHSDQADVIVHMTDESWFRGFAGHPQHGTWACQYRAIETRRWQLVCANWANSAVIDPTGHIRQILPATAGSLATMEASHEP